MQLPAGRLVSVNLAVVCGGDWTADGGDTGIDKRPAPGRIRAQDDRLLGDTVVDPRHGGYDQAAYAYAREDATWWATELSRDVAPGAFGENLSTEGVDVSAAVIGERWAIGSAVFEVSSPRIPCRTLAGFWEVRDMIKRFTARGAPGAYLRIVTDGELGAGDAVTVVHRPGHGVTVAETFRALTGDRTLAERLLQAPELPARYQARARRWLGVQEPSAR
ncbi:MAG TPA: MOSC domain-containing protein [Cryptosporangiaceae bacterium]|nr:MOSC domain-containing protein [Cryptosporangiaceae bacterium]